MPVGKAKRVLPAEWEAQDGIMLAWPHKDTDWQSYMDKAGEVYLEISVWISFYEKLFIVSEDKETIRPKLIKAGANLQNVFFFPVLTNDTWTRDFGPVTVLEDGKPRLLDFSFNGWGLKFASNLDNQVNRKLHLLNAFGNTPMDTLGMVLEGGSIESDGKGTILTTSECLLSPNRNPSLSKDEIEKQLAEYVGAERIHWLDHGFLEGDDTDSHVDTLARFCPGDTIAFVFTDNPDDIHYHSLSLMKDQLKLFRTSQNKPYQLLPLPLPSACYDSGGNRLPATYANFLVINDAVLLPSYEDEEHDGAAKETLKTAFPGREVIQINCRPLILQHGSLHCATMQFPKGVFE